ncbi:MauE/DoxX family redox-associated membrane protein [Streptomyces synnematoformans]|uniref:Methylamine utilisation protein MauE domain-containing protein n=1 Tax=Streptomyces synnematoformans TaxID=415721 RepID=A0ABN2YZE7_9ACTN
MIALLVGGVLGWTGGTKLFGRNTRAQAADTVLERRLGGLPRATVALRAVGAAELLVALVLVALPWPLVTGAAAALAGAGFAAYLGYARATAPDASCGCTARDKAPIGVRAFARAGFVLAGGAVVLADGLAAGGVPAAAGGPWWEALRDRPSAALAWLPFGDPDRSVRLPLRRLRLRLFGHPLHAGAGRAGDPAAVPVEGSVELVERSLAWQTVSHVVRSGLREHWDEDGWRFLRYTGLHGTAEGPGRPVSVVFAMDAKAGLDSPRPPVIRVGVVDEETGARVDVAAGAAGRERPGALLGEGV